MQLLDTPLGEKIAAVADDVIVRQMDFNGADVVADRLAAANPLAQIDETSEIPPQAQMMIKGLQQQVQKMGQALQAAGVELKFGIEKEQIKQDGETKRTLLTTDHEGARHRDDRATKRHDTETRALTAQNVAEIAASWTSCSSTSTPRTSSARSKRATRAAAEGRDGRLHRHRAMRGLDF
jgi:hypothetical protein